MFQCPIWVHFQTGSKLDIRTVRTSKSRGNKFRRESQWTKTTTACICSLVISSYKCFTGPNIIGPACLLSRHFLAFPGKRYNLDVHNPCVFRLLSRVEQSFVPTWRIQSGIFGSRRRLLSIYLFTPFTVLPGQGCKSISTSAFFVRDIGSNLEKLFIVKLHDSCDMSHVTRDKIITWWWNHR